VFRYEDDQRHSGPETIDTAVTFLREAVQLAETTVRETRGAPAAVYNLRGIRDRLAGALAVRNTVPDVDAAIALYIRNRDEAASLGPGMTAGESASLATAYIRRWLLTREAADRERARAAYAEAFATGEAAHLPAASHGPTATLMKAFYQEWRGKPAAPRQALRAAQQWTRDQRHASPLAWANFVYVGP